jgi:hypothetical protein
MAGDNNLEEYGQIDIQEMKRVGSDNELNMVVQFDRMSDHHTRRYFLRQGTSIKADIVQELGETNTGDPEVAIDFLRWGINTYPAQYYLVVLWNHGSGIDETDIFKRAAERGLQAQRKVRRSSNEIPRSTLRSVVSRRYHHSLFSSTLECAFTTRAIAIDETARDFLDNIELKQVFTKLIQNTKQKIDLIGFDACLMNMVEIAYQLKDKANFMVGSEETEPGEGWPYDRILKDLASNPNMTPLELGQVIVQRYVESYSDETVTQSLLDLNQSFPLGKKVDQLAKSLTKAIEDPAEYAAVTRAIHSTQCYELKDFLDLNSLCEELKRRSRKKEVRGSAQAVLTALTDGSEKFVVAEKHKGSKVTHSHGVSIYFPRGDVTVVYPRLDFAKATHWDEFIKAYHGK